MVSVLLNSDLTPSSFLFLWGSALEGGPGWSFSRAHRGHLSSPFTHDQVTPHSVAFIAATLLSASHAGVKLSCHHAVQGTPVGALGPLHSGRYITSPPPCPHRPNTPTSVPGRGSAIPTSTSGCSS